MNWKIDLNKAGQLAKEAKEQLYERVKLLCKVFDDPDFQRDCEENDRDPYEYLTTFLSDTRWEFHEVRAIYENFPKKSDWETNSLKVLMAECVERQEKKPKPTPSYKTLYFEAKAKVEKLEHKLEMMNQEVKNQKETIDELRRIIRILENKAA